MTPGGMPQQPGAEPNPDLLSEERRETRWR